MATPIFIGGTSSNAGKSWMTTAICAWLRRQHVRVAPFKAQTMSNHSYPCVDGGEIGRAQAAQAAACGLAPESAMNPILLKPNRHGTSQVIVRGRVWRTLAARDYYRHVDQLIPEVQAAYDDLARRFDVIVIEGAGSVSEINLHGVDLVNLGFAVRVGAPWVLVADIERGGVFAATAGTVALLDEYQRRLFRGVLVNKFRGDRSLFDDGKRLLKERCGAPCLGVFPYAADIALDSEDSLAIDRRARMAPPAGAAIAIVDLPALSNGTDFRLLTWADWIDAPTLKAYDFVVLPGTKDTIGALAWLRERGLDAWIRGQHARGATVIGICGGFQMLGEMVRDPDATESSAGESEGMGLLPVETVLAAEKTTCEREAVTPHGVRFMAYEIHLGVTRSREPLSPFARLADGTPEGVRLGRVWGTYLHGALENAAVCAEIFGTPMPLTPRRGSEYDALADWFERYADAPREWVPRSQKPEARSQK